VVPSLISDAVDAYVVRRLNARLQFLLMQRRADAPFGSSWQAIHARIAPEETAIIAAERALAETTGLVARTVYSADYVNQIFDHTRDAIVLIPVFAFEVEAQAGIDPGPDFLGYEWCEREEATARLLWAGQRWSVRHIDDVIGAGGPTAEFYRIR
jgi:dATP pyrophosphohydrolase